MTFTLSVTLVLPEQTSSYERRVLPVPRKEETGCGFDRPRGSARSDRTLITPECRVAGGRLNVTHLAQLRPPSNLAYR
jgi:hypothetical protein